MEDNDDGIGAIEKIAKQFQDAMRGLQAEARATRVRLTAAESLLSPAVAEVAKMVRDAGELDQPSHTYAVGAALALQARLLDGAGREALLLAAVRAILALRALDTESEGGADVG